MSEWVMPFGKHRGKELAAIPRGYLTWLLANVADLYPETRTVIEAYLAGPVTTSPGEPAPTVKRRRARTPQSTDALHGTPAPAGAPTGATCSRCGLDGSPARPLVHASCILDEVPF